MEAAWAVLDYEQAVQQAKRDCPNVKESKATIASR